MLSEIARYKKLYLECNREVAKDWWLASAFAVWKLLDRKETDFNPYWKDIK